VSDVSALAARENVATTRKAQALGEVGRPVLGHRTKLLPNRDVNEQRADLVIDEAPPLINESGRD
jgi:hypothetical protein